MQHQNKYNSSRPIGSNRIAAGRLLGRLLLSACAKLHAQQDIGLSSAAAERQGVVAGSKIKSNIVRVMTK